MGGGEEWEDEKSGRRRRVRGGEEWEEEKVPEEEEWIKDSYQRVHYSIKTAQIAD